MEIIEHSITGIKEFEFLSGWLFSTGVEYGVVCNIFTTVDDSVFTFTIRFTSENIERGHLELFKSIFVND